MTSLFTTADLAAGEIDQIIESSRSFRNNSSGSPSLNATVATVFFEPSTRTRLSFELAAARLGCSVVSFDPTSSSLAKGESLKDTVQTVAALGADVLIIRHSEVGTPETVERWTGCPVINAGDGRRAHPTQTLADLLTILDRFGAIDGVRVGLIGDIVNSRVARGLLDVFPRMGADVTMIGPPTFLPEWPGVKSSTSLDDVLPSLDVVYLLRVQKERGGKDGYPSDGEYRQRFGLTEARAASLNPDAVILHPGPLNRGVEIDASVADGKRSLILSQVANGVPVRMAVIERSVVGS